MQDPIASPPLLDPTEQLGVASSQQISALSICWQPVPSLFASSSQYVEHHHTTTTRIQWAPPHRYLQQSEEPSIGTQECLLQAKPQQFCQSVASCFSARHSAQCCRSWCSLHSTAHCSPMHALHTPSLEGCAHMHRIPKSAPETPLLEGSWQFGLWGVKLRLGHNSANRIRARDAWHTCDCMKSDCDELV